MTILESSAGGAVFHRGKVLVIRVRRDRWELPKGHVEPGETPARAAVRETLEETGLRCALRAGAELGVLEYPIRDRRKRVRYFALSPAGEPELGPLPAGTRERRWIDRAEAAALPLVSEDLRPIITRALP